MALFLVERSYSERFHIDQDEISQVRQVAADEGISWIYSFLSADKKKTYCIYEAPSVGAMHEFARRMDVSLGEIIEVSELLQPEMLDALRSR